MRSSRTAASLPLLNRNSTVTSTVQHPNSREIEIMTTRVTASTRVTVPDDEISIAIMGATGSGKTTFINLVSGSDLRIGRGLESCTTCVQPSPAFELDGLQVTLVDTPGFDDTNQSDNDILKMLALFLSTAYEGGKKLSGVIYMHRISDFRVGGISKRNFKMFRELCGDTTLKNVILVTNMWGEVTAEVGEAREKELASEDKFFKPALDKHARLLRHDNSIESAQDIIRQFFRNKPKALRIQRELVDQHKDISRTAAGEELGKELNALVQKHRRDMAMLQDEMNIAIKQRDEETRKELEEESRKLQEEMSRVQTQSQNLASEYNEDKARLERVMEESRQQAHRAEEEYRTQVRELERKLHETMDTSAAENEAIARKLEELKNDRRRRGFLGRIGGALDSLFG